MEETATTEEETATTEKETPQTPKTLNEDAAANERQALQKGL